MEPGSIVGRMDHFYHHFGTKSTSGFQFCYVRIPSISKTGCCSDRSIHDLSLFHLLTKSFWVTMDEKGENIVYRLRFCSLETFIDYLGRITKKKRKFWKKVHFLSISFQLCGSPQNADHADCADRAD